jgi:hypothetical protein
MRLPLPKALAAVVSRVEASLEGPGLRPVVKVLDHSPLGPATGVLGALQPGVDRVLTVRGFDLDDALIFEGQARGIAITAGDTVRVQLDLFLVGPTPSDPDPPVVDEGTETGGAGPGDDEVPIDGPPDEAGEPVEEGVPADPPEVGTPVGDESPDQEENTSQEESAAQTEGEADGEPPEVPEDSVPVTEDNNSGDAAG